MSSNMPLGLPGLQGSVVDYLLAGSHRLERCERPYLITPERAWSLGELAERVGRAANFLKSIGVNPGERVVFSAPDGIEFPTLFLAIMKIGAVAIPVNTYLKPDDFRYFISDSGAVAAVVDAAVAAHISARPDEFPTVRRVVSLGAAPGVVTDFSEAIACFDADCPTTPVAPDAMAFWLYSSGSTGAPKGVVHTGAHLYWATELFGLRTLGIDDSDVILSPPKMFFAFGLGNQVYFPLRAGARVITNPQPISAEIVWRQWLQHEPTVVMGVPTLFAALLRLAQDELGQERVRRACRRLRYCVSGGEVLPASLLERWRDFTGVEILDGVGTTEMTHMFLVNRQGESAPGSCGRLVEGYRAQLLDEEGREVPRGEIGNLRVFGPSAAEQYWKNPEKTAQVMGGGGVLTGDKAYVDERGNHFLVGRSDDMLRVGGIWVSPTEVESVIARHEAVLECAVVGWPDGDNMIKPKAFVIPRDSNLQDAAALAESLREHVRASLAHFKCPRWFEFVSDLPRTSTGKIQRFRLRKPIDER